VVCIVSSPDAQCAAILVELVKAHTGEPLRAATRPELGRLLVQHPDAIVVLDAPTVAVGFSQKHRQARFVIAKKPINAVLLQAEVVTCLHRTIACPDDAAGFGMVLQGESAPIRRARAMLNKAAQSEIPILITGETGTGKSVAAGAIHRVSRRHAAPIQKINLGGIPPELLDAELFGFKRGAFTSAHTDRIGLIEAANRGTLFLDEIGDMAPTAQCKLLHFMDDGMIRRLGENTLRQVNTRIIAATNRNLRDLIQLQKFREDLFYRIACIEVRLPALRERREDIPLLVQEFAALNARDVSPCAMTFLVEQDWPGNVRQLKHAMESADCLADPGILDVESFRQIVLAISNTSR
jgi:two-component system NtrC family response regulator